jgi:hypothetical protein
MTMRRRPTSRRLLCSVGARRTVAWLVVLLRVLAVVSVFQLSGAGHLAGDAVEIITLGHHADDGDEHENHQCPPGCPKCHHIHASAASLPLPFEPILSWVPGVDGEVLLLSYDGNEPLAPYLSAVYRPPRATLLHT